MIFADAVLVVRLTATADKEPAAVAVLAELIDESVGKSAVCKAESDGPVFVESLKQLFSVIGQDG